MLDSIGVGVLSTGDRHRFRENVVVDHFVCRFPRMGDPSWSPSTVMCTCGRYRLSGLGHHDSENNRGRTCALLYYGDVRKGSSCFGV